MLNDKFQQIYCINLDRRQDRWKEANDLFNRFDISVKRISAIEDDPAWNGLRLTVISVFEDAIKNGYENILIFEDDIDWAENFSERFQQHWENLPQNWDMFYFSAAHQLWPQQHNEYFFRLSWSTAAHAIAFKSTCFESVLESLKNTNDAIDVIYSRLQPNLNAYCCINPIAWQRRSFSDIEKEEKWYPYLKDLEFYRKYMNGLVTIDGTEVQPHGRGYQ